MSRLMIRECSGRVETTKCFSSRVVYLLPSSNYRSSVQAKMITPSIADLVDLFDAEGAFIFGRSATYCHAFMLIGFS
jgi:hypothetical protein